MEDVQDEAAVIVRRSAILEAVYTRRFGHSVESVWAALTEPQGLAQWLAPGRIELRQGGAARLDFADSGIVIDSLVSGFEEGRLLEYSWSGPGEPLRPVRWRLEPHAGGCQLTLTLQVPQAEDAARSFAGWEAHLEMLAAALEGVPIKFPFDRFKSARDAYRAQLATA